MPGPATTRSTGSTSTSIEAAVPAWTAKLQQEIASLNNKLDKVTVNIEDKITKLIEPVSSVNCVLQESVNHLTQKVRVQQSQIDYLRTKCTATTDRIIKLEMYSMRENLIFTGLDESPGETEDSIRDSLMTIFSHELELDTTSINMVRCHRLRSKRDRPGPRDVIARFTTLTSKREILYAARKLRGRKTPLFINEQFTYEVDQQRRILRPILKLAKNQNVKASLVQNKLIMRGRSFTTNNFE